MSYTYMGGGGGGGEGGRGRKVPLPPPQKKKNEEMKEGHLKNKNKSFFSASDLEMSPKCFTVANI